MVCVAGLIPEFVGRFPVVVNTNGLTMEQMVRVLTEPKNALIKQYRYLFSLHEVDFHITDEALREVATIALRKNTVRHHLFHLHTYATALHLLWFTDLKCWTCRVVQGARGLRSILEKVLMQAMFEVPDDHTVTGVFVDKEAIHTRK